MNRIALTSLIATLALLAAAPVFAKHGGYDAYECHQDHYRGHSHDHEGDSRHSQRAKQIRKRMARQSWRIDAGIDDGSLTRKEARKLHKQQDKIRHLARKFKRDGYITRKEHRILIGKLDRAGDRIYRLKHNDLYRLRHHHGERHEKYDSKRTSFNRNSSQENGQYSLN